MNDFLQTLLHWSASSSYWLGAAIFLVALLECLALVGILLPGVVLLFALAVLAGNGALDLSSVLLLAWLGGLSGDILSYALGRRLQHKVPQLPIIRNHPQWLINAELHFARYGVLSLLVGRFIGPLRPVLPLVAGMLAMPLTRFVVVSLFAAAGWAVAYLLPGWMVGAALELHPPELFLAANSMGRLWHRWLCASQCFGLLTRLAYSQCRKRCSIGFNPRCFNAELVIFISI